MGVYLLLVVSGLALTASFLHTGGADHGPALTDRLDKLERASSHLERRLQQLEAEKRMWEEDKQQWGEMGFGWEESNKQWRAELQRDLEMAMRHELDKRMAVFRTEQLEKEQDWKRQFETEFDSEKELWRHEKLKWNEEKQELKQYVAELTKNLLKNNDKDLVSTSADHVAFEIEGIDSSIPHDVMSRADDPGAWEPVVAQMSQQLSGMAAEVQLTKNEIQSMKNVNTQQDQAIQESRASVFVRWGRSVCPNSDRLVYSGVVGGSWYDNSGAASNYLCMSMSPVFSSHAVPSSYGYVYGGEYQTYDGHIDNNPPCAVCRSARPTTMMVPGTNQCPSGWTLEYSGHLMAGDYSHTAASEYICVDIDLEDRPSGQTNENGKLLYYTITRCGSLPCPPYDNNKVVTCAVCSK